MSVSGRIQLSIDVAEVQDSPTSAGAPHTRHTALEDIILSDGVTSGKFDAVWSKKEATIATATDLDLYGGIADVFGTTINAVEIVFYYIKNHSTTATLTIGGDASAAALLFIDGNESIGPGGFRCGYYGNSNNGFGAIANGATDVLQLTPSASLTYTMILGVRLS